MTRDNSPNSLSYHLAYYLILLGKATGGPCYWRLNLISLICQTAAALAPSEAINQELDAIFLDITDLRSSYEPMIDHDEFACQKRGDFDTLLDIQFGKIADIIKNNDLIQRSTIQEVMASRWDSGGGKTP